jgi:putative flippase GtrA
MKGLKRFLGFGAVGTAGFLVDALVLHLLLPQAGPYFGRAFSFLCAVTTTYELNRRFVFHDTAHGLAWASGWLRFVAANAVGAAVNLGVYAALLESKAPILGSPIPALAAGSIAGMAFNFTLSALVVFRARKVG